MTKPKCFNCPSCGGSNRVGQRTCGHCLAALQTPRIRKQQSRIQACGWASQVKKNRNAGRILGSAELSVLKLQELGMCPVLFVGKQGRNGQLTADLLQHFPDLDSVGQDILRKMKKLYEHLLKRLFVPQLLQPSTSAAPLPPVVHAAPEQEFVLHLTAVDPLASSSHPQPAPHTLASSSHPQPAPHTLASSSHPQPAPHTLDSSSHPQSAPHTLASSFHTQSAINTLASSSHPQPLSTMPAISLYHPSSSTLSCSGSDLCSSSLVLSAPTPVCTPNPGGSSGKNKRPRMKECRKHRRQTVFLYEEVVDKRVVNGKNEVKIRWAPCATCGKQWDDTWEPAEQYT